jgi:hypothetical protein
VHALAGSFSAEIKTILERPKAIAKEVDADILLAKAQTDREEQKQQADEREAAARQRQILAPFFSKASKEINEAVEERKRVAERRKGICQVDLGTSCSIAYSFDSGAQTKASR